MGITETAKNHLSVVDTLMLFFQHNGIPLRIHCDSWKEFKNLLLRTLVPFMYVPYMSVFRRGIKEILGVFAQKTFANLDLQTNIVALHSVLIISVWSGCKKLLLMSLKFIKKKISYGLPSTRVIIKWKKMMWRDRYRNECLGRWVQEKSEFALLSALRQQKAKMKKSYTYK